VAVGWVLVGLSRDLGARQAMAASTDWAELAVWRAEWGRVTAWKDRCLHRGLRSMPFDCAPERLIAALPEVQVLAPDVVASGDLCQVIWPRAWGLMVLTQGGDPVAQSRWLEVQCLRELEAHLTEGRFRGHGLFGGRRCDHCRHYLFSGRVTLAPDGGVSHDDFASVRLWTRAVRSLPGFAKMPGIHRLHHLKPDPHLSIAKP